MAASLEITRPPNRISQWPLTLNIGCCGPSGIFQDARASAAPLSVTRCGSDDPFNPEMIQDTTINGDVVVDGWCLLGPGAVINRNVLGGRGGGLDIGVKAVVNGSVTLNGGNLYMGGPSNFPAGPPATVTGNIEVVNSAGVGVFDLKGVFIGLGEVGGDVTLKNVPSFNMIGTDTEGELYVNIGGSVSIQNVREGPHSEGASGSYSTTRLAGVSASRTSLAPASLRATTSPVISVARTLVS